MQHPDPKGRGVFYVIRASAGRINKNAEHPGIYHKWNTFKLTAKRAVRRSDGPDSLTGLNEKGRPKRMMDDYMATLKMPMTSSSLAVLGLVREQASFMAFSAMALKSASFTFRADRPAGMPTSAARVLIASMPL